MVRSVRSGVRLLACCLAFLALCAGVAEAAIPASQRAVLVALYNQTNGASWNIRTNWNGAAGTECTWEGVYCDTAQNNVIVINLRANNLTGTLPALSGLVALQSFDVSNPGGFIPPNQITGSIPSLTGLTALRYFDVSGNKMNGTMAGLAGLTSLEEFRAADNLLTGPIPPLTGLTALKNFYVSRNQLSGTIPSFAGLTSLRQFLASFNQLSGPPPSLAGLPVFDSLELHNNQLTGSIPSLAGVTTLAYYHVTNNQLTGSLPSLTGLTALYIFQASNNQLTGTIPSLSGLTQLQWFDVSRNQLVGPIPTLTGLTRLQRFIVNNNQLSGPVPAGAPSNFAGQSNLCVNALSSSGNSSIDAAWTTAAGNWQACQTAVVAPYCTLTATPNTFASGTATNVSLVASCAPTATSYSWSSPAGAPVVSGGSSVNASFPASTSQGTYTYSVRGTSSAAGTGTPATATVTVGVRPAITSANATTFIVGSANSFTVTATGSPAPSISQSGALPAGVTFTPAGGVLSGNPTAASIGTWPISFLAINSVGTASQSFTLTVAPGVPGKPVISSVVASVNKLTLNFAAPPSNGSPIKRYDARCTNGAETRTGTASAPPVIVDGLTGGVQWACTVNATNDVGTGSDADPANGTPTGGRPVVNLGFYDFGGQSMGTTSPAHEVTITNPANASGALTLTSVSVSAQFGQSHNCTNVLPGGSCKLSVTFSPAPADGVINATSPVTGTVIGVGSLGYDIQADFAGTAEKSFISHYYRSILRRDPDGGGKTFWQNEAARVAALGANVNETWFALAATFYASPEYTAQNRNTTEYVRDLYNTFYNRGADDAGLNFWTGQINSGLPREVALISFMFSTEFNNFTQAIFGNTTARAEVNTVIDFYRGILGGLPDDAGFTYWRNQFRAAQCQGAAAVTSQVEVISGAFVGSPQYANRARNNSQYVTDLYNAFLRRGGDLAGFNYWVGYVTNPPALEPGEPAGTGRERARRKFIASGEFQARVNAIIAQGCLP